MLEWFAPLILAIWSSVCFFICLSDNMPRGLYRYKGRIILYFCITLLSLSFCFLNAIVDYQSSQDKMDALILENKDLIEDLKAADNVISLLIDSAEITIPNNSQISSDPSSEPNQSSSTPPYVASSVTKLVHRSDCNHLPSSNSSHFYDTIRDAMLNSYDLCPYCFS